MDKFQNERYSSGRKKHNRRCAHDIERKFTCPYQKCDKYYGSEGSLNLHIKIKHNGGNKTDREKIAKSIVFAKANGIDFPENLEVNLPPGSVEKAATQVGYTIDSDSIKVLEQQMAVLNEKNAKIIKDIEMSRFTQQENNFSQTMQQVAFADKQLKFLNHNQSSSMFKKQSSFYQQPNDENHMRTPLIHKSKSSTVMFADENNCANS